MKFIWLKLINTINNKKIFLIFSLPVLLTIVAIVVAAFLDFFTLFIPVLASIIGGYMTFVVIFYTNKKTIETNLKAIEEGKKSKKERFIEKKGIEKK